MVTTSTPFHPTPYPYQLHGAINAAWNGKRIIADEMGLGKTIQGLLTARLTGAHRILVICPPILTTNWAAEINRSGNLNTIHGAALTLITAGTPTPDALPEAGYVVASDALTATRRPLQDLLAAWQPDLLLVDEAHRFKNPAARRTRAVTRIAATAGTAICITGTPIVSTPLDLLPLLKITRTLHHIADTGRAYTDRYTREIPWIPGKREPRTENLDELHALLEQHVWTRRTKTQVLPQLPAKRRTVQHVTPDSATVRSAMDDLEGVITDWLAKHPNPTREQIAEFTQDALPFMSQLRRATGLAKVPAAVDWISRHLDEQPAEPLIVWTIHRDVTTQIHAETLKNRPRTRVRVLDGSQGHRERSDAVEAFQEGSVDVLIAQIIAAGVGLTLTRSTTALFAETDWTPANVAQAEDRIHRIGQTQPVTITTLIADGTLDARIHAILANTISTLDKLTPGSDHHVTSGPGLDTTGPRDILTSLIREHLTNGAAA